jgi:RimJ/RimL family protein N-acetyltransferase
MPCAGPSFLIETAQLVIRPWEQRDDPGFRQMATDPEMVRYTSVRTPWSDERIAEFFARQSRHLAARGYCFGAMIDRATDRVAGLCGFQPSANSADVEIGWWVRKDLWGRGLATEAAAGALRHAWDFLGLDRVIAVAYAENRASIRIMEKLGFRRERRLPGDLGRAAPEAEVEEVVVYAIERPPAETRGVR